MQSLEYRRYDQSLILLFKCIKENNGPDYISNLFEYRKSHYAGFNHIFAQNLCPH